MSSILTNNSAMNALTTMRNINNQLDSTQNRISTGLKVNSGKDNAAYFAISESMKGDSGMTKSINESLTLTKNSVATARLGAEQFSELAGEFLEKISFAQENKGGLDEIEADLQKLVADMGTIIDQSTFNGDDLVNAAGTQSDGAASIARSIDEAGILTETNASGPAADRDVVTGISRSGGNLKTTSIKVGSVDLYGLKETLELVATDFKTRVEDTNNNHGNADGTANSTLDGEDFMANALTTADAVKSAAISAATSLGQSEKSIERQQEFLNKLSDNLDSGVGSMVDANMEEEAARLQALQVQQQLATQSLTMANQKPQNILSLFR